MLNFPDALILLRLNEIGFSVTGVILAYVSYNVVYAVASYPAGVLVDRVTLALVFGGGVCFLAVVHLGLALTATHTVAWLVIALYGLFAAATDGVGKAWVSSLAGDKLQGAAQGIFQGASGLAAAAAGLWAGLLWRQDGRIPLMVSGCGTAVFALALLTLGLRLCPRRARKPLAP